MVTTIARLGVGNTTQSTLIQQTRALSQFDVHILFEEHT